MLKGIDRPLDNFSVFPFESYLRIIKRHLRSPNHPLEQLLNRLVEHSSISNSHVQDRNIILQQKHASGPLVDGMSKSTEQYKKLIFNEYIVCVSSLKDSALFFPNQTVVLARNIVKMNDKIYVVGNKFSNYQDLFYSPCNSSHLGIFKLQGLYTLSAFNLEGARKCVLIPYGKHCKGNSRTDYNICEII